MGLRNPNKIASAAWDRWSRRKLLEGNFKEVEYSETSDGNYKSTKFNACEYSIKHSRVARVLHDKLVKAGYVDGIYTNKRNAVFTAAVDKAAESMTVEEINTEGAPRFRTMFD